MTDQYFLNWIFPSWRPSRRRCSCSAGIPKNQPACVRQLQSIPTSFIQIHQTLRLDRPGNQCPQAKSLRLQDNKQSNLCTLLSLFHIWFFFLNHLTMENTCINMHNTWYQEACVHVWEGHLHCCFWVGRSASCNYVLCGSSFSSNISIGARLHFYLSQMCSVAANSPAFVLIFVISLLPG